MDNSILYVFISFNSIIFHIENCIGTWTWYMFLFIITSCVKYNLPRYTHMLTDRWTMPVYILIYYITHLHVHVEAKVFQKCTHAHHGSSSIINCNIPRRNHLVFCWFGVWDLYMLFSFRDPLRPVHCDICIIMSFSGHRLHLSVNSSQGPASPPVHEANFNKT